MDIEEKIGLFSEMLLCGNEIYLWEYNAKGEFLKTNCPNENIFETAFIHFGCKDLMLEKASKRISPMMLSSSVGLTWLMSYEEKNSEICRIFTIGPVFMTDVTVSAIEHILRVSKEINVSTAWKNRFYRAIENVPVISFLILNQLALFLHYCVTGEKLKTGAIAHSSTKDSFVLEDNKPKTRDRHKVWQFEQMLMQKIRDGNLDYDNALMKTSSVSNGVPVSANDPLRQSKITNVAYTSLATRAAIEGGLTPEEAYSIGDAYIQAGENAKTLSEIAAINSAMYKDFVKRVNGCRTNPDVSKLIQSCVDYIERRAEENTTIDMLASRFGYTSYYLSKRFKQEMGTSVNTYIRIVKIEHAKTLLTSSDLSIQSITDKLGFCSRSYFSEVFQKIVGTSPAKYREANKHI